MILIEWLLLVDLLTIRPSWEEAREFIHNMKVRREAAAGRAAEPSPADRAP